MKKALIGIFVVLIVAGGIGGYGYLYYQSATGLKLDIKTVDLKEYRLNSDGSVGFRAILDGTVMSGNSIKVSIDNATYFVEVDGFDIGSGTTNSFVADSDGEQITIYLEWDKIYGNGANIIEKWVSGKTLTLRITITSVTIYGRTFNTTLVTEEPIVLI